MTLEISLFPPFSLPRVLLAQKGDFRQHWVGQTPPAALNKIEEENQGNKPQREDDEPGYRPLSKITLGEVDDAYERFKHQLIPVRENWIGKHCFCTIPLKPIRDNRPSKIFGRVKTCSPSDGYSDYIDELELIFPCTDGALPDKVHISKEDISQFSQELTQSYYIRVQFKASEEDMTDFGGAAPQFGMNGFHLDFDSGYYDLLEMNELNQSRYPWLYVIGSRWLNAIPDSIYPEVKIKLMEMLQWGKHIFNYHPEWLSTEINTLNRVLGFKYGFTEQVLVEPGNIEETGIIVARIFDRIMSIPAS